jgi:emfourin
VKLSVVRGGGLAGIATRTEVTSDVLSDEGARTLRDKVEQAGVLTMEDALPRRGSHPDESHYELVVEDEGREHSVRLSEGTMPESVRSLIAWADSVPEREERIEAPGADAPPA